MRKNYIEFSTYNIMNSECPRVAIMDLDEDGSGNGTLLYGNKFSVSRSIKTFKIPLTVKLIDDFIEELNKAKNNMLESEK